MNAKRLAEIEEQLETVPEAQFQSERKLKAALASVQAERNALEESNKQLTAALQRIADGRVGIGDIELYAHAVLKVTP